MVCQGVLLLPWNFWTAWSPGHAGTVLCKPDGIKGTELELLAERHGTISAFQKWGAFSSLGGEQGQYQDPVPAKRDRNAPIAVQWLEAGSWL